LQRLPAYWRNLLPLNGSSADEETTAEFSAASFGIVDSVILLIADQNAARKPRTVIAINLSGGRVLHLVSQLLPSAERFDAVIVMRG
jgi:hypothetical protein